MKRSLLSGAVSLGLIAILSPITAKALPRTGLPGPLDSGQVHSSMLGGSYDSISNGPYAAILALSGGSGFSCSGVLIGSREVLTAAHCVISPSDEPQFTSDNYEVVVGGEQHSVTAIFYNSGYNPNAPVTDASSRYDLGMLILDSEVTGAAPLSVPANYPLSAGDVGTLYGYGTNEQPENSDVPLTSRGKYGQLTIASVAGGVFQSTYANSEVTSCAGDSGGPVVVDVDGSFYVAGVVSAGTTRTTEAGACQSTGSYDDSIFVDLQSTQSQSFLRAFPYCESTSDCLYTFKSIVDSVVPKLTVAKRKRNLSRIKQESANAITALSSFAAAPSRSRATKLLSAFRRLSSCRSSRSVSAALKILNAAISDLKGVSALGLQ